MSVEAVTVDSVADQEPDLPEGIGRITRIEAHRYRCFRKLEVSLSSFNVLAGANGSGKTTLLDIPVLLGDLLGQRSCSEAFLESSQQGLAPRAKALPELIFQEKGNGFVLALEAQLPQRVIRQVVQNAPKQIRNDASRWPTRLRYELEFGLSDAATIQVENEHLFFFAAKGECRPEDKLLNLKASVKSGWHSILRREGSNPARFFPECRMQEEPLRFKIPPTQLIFASLPNDPELFPAAVWFREFLRKGTVFYELDWLKLRRASPPGLPSRVIPEGSNLPWLVLRLQQEAPQRFEDWVAHVRTALEQISTIEAREREDDHHAYLRIRYEGGYTVTSSGLSEGTLRILALTILPYLTQQPGMLATEQPEDGLHPSAIESVLQSLSSLYDSQVWVSTHSPIVLAHTELEHLLCMQLREDGSAGAIPGPEHPRLKKWRGEIDLGSLYASGVLS